MQIHGRAGIFWYFFHVLRLNKILTEFRVKPDDAVVSFVLPTHTGDFFFLPFLLKWAITESQQLLQGNLEVLLTGDANLWLGCLEHHEVWR